MSEQITEAELQQEVEPKEKAKVAAEVLPKIKGNSSVLLSGSLSLLVAGKKNGDKVVITPTDLQEINDIDIAVILNQETIHNRPEVSNGVPGFGVESNDIYQNCAYETSGVSHLVIASAEVEMEGFPDSAGKIYYTTPEFLLLSLVDDEATMENAEKFHRKVDAIQKHSKFESEKFKTLARNEIAARRAMNEDTFTYWKRKLSSDMSESGFSLAEAVDHGYDDVDSLVDQTQIFNWINTGGKLEDLDYSEVRKIPNLEQFLSELE